MELTFNADALDQMSLSNLLRQAKLRGLVIFQYNRPPHRSELRDRVAQRDNQIARARKFPNWPPRAPDSI